VKVGITLPQFRDDAEPALAVARRAEAVGLDGVFVFDHLWPLRQPQRPALHSTTLLGALAVETDAVTLGTLVARVSLVPNAVLVHAFVTLSRMLGPRLVAGIGTGDEANRDENEAYGVGFPALARRLEDLTACARDLRAAGITTWVGGCSPALRRAAAAADGWNGWGSCARPEVFAETAADVRRTVAAAGGDPALQLSWGGQVLVAADEAGAADKLERHGERPGLLHGTVADLARHLRALAGAGAAWAVCAPLDVGTDPEVVEMVAEAAAGVPL
jgi:alkanesulfonate monooxygenase SsuD/methylene tetrahydromethanopterin reductase-like flavin-dependent oxidoreductase (luciferase family)